MDLGIEGLEWREVIGHGGFGTVHLAHDADHGRDVAVKVLAPLADEREERRFDRERRIMGQLSAHPNIVTIHTSGVSALGVPYLVMEYVTGGSLADRSEQGALDPAEVIAIGTALADALGEAHAAGILHRDIKPPNILMGRSNLPLLTDFGIASASSDLSMRDTVSATPAYAPPEVLTGREVDERGDVYSLAATLHACLTGEGPYSTSGQPVLTVLNRIANDPVPMIDRDDVPAGLTTLLHRSLSKEPDERPPTMAAFRDELAAIDLDEPPYVAPPPMDDATGDPLATAAVTGGAATDPSDPQATSSVGGITPPPPPDTGEQPVISPPPEPIPATAAEEDDGGRRTGILLLGAAAVILVIAAIVLLTGGSDDGDDVEAGGAATDETAATTTEAGSTSTVVAASDTTTTTETDSTTTTTSTPETTTTTEAGSSGGSRTPGITTPAVTTPAVTVPPPETSPPATSPPATNPPETSPPPPPPTTAAPTTAPPPPPTTQALVTVPNVSGLSIPDARGTLQNAGFVVNSAPACSNGIAQGTSPFAGEAVAPGSTIDLAIAPCIVPNYVGLRLPDAIALSQSIDGLTISWPNHCDNLVLGQSIGAGAGVARGTNITLTLPTEC
ncbi:MAG: protein kinase [Actinomycetota bacterium]